MLSRPTSRRSRSRELSLLGCLLLLLVPVACEEIKIDPQLDDEERIVRQQVDQTLAGGQPDLAQGALHTFVQQIDTAETRGLASSSQIRRGREFVDQAMQRIEQAREDQKVTQIEAQVETYLGGAKFGQARRYVRMSLHQLNPSAVMEVRLREVFERIETAQIRAIREQVKQDLAGGGIRMARSRVELALNNPEFSEAGLRRLQQLQDEIRGAVPTPSPPTPSPPPSVATAVQPPKPDVFGLEFVEVPAGRYLVGSPRDEPGRDPGREAEPEEVRLPAFYISVTEVTQAGFTRVVPRTWKRFSGPQIPAHSVSFNDAELYCERLTELDGQWIFSLPSEVEWEIAARALKPPAAGPVVGRREDRDRFRASPETAALTLQKYCFFLLNKQRSGPMPVRQKLANALGLYDMHGNVAEWCRPASDLGHWYQGSLLERPTRGGSVLSGYERCRAGSRAFEREDTRKPTIGFRIVARRR